MTGGRLERRLAAVLAADVAGYSRLMGADEVGTLSALKDIRREVIDPTLAEHKGRIVKSTGDGMLVEFASAVDAVSCAMTVQSKMVERGDAAPRISFRIGINVGDIIVEGGDIFGDGVNVAARIENECEPGGVFLSGSAFEQVRGKTEFAFDDLGERSLKNIERPVRLYAVRSPTAEPVSLAQTSVRSGTVFSLPDKPSIAVLPFQNMSGDSEQEYFADGIVEDIITALSRFKSLFVIARNSSFTYKGKRMDIRQVGRELGVRYILEGSVRKAGGRVRVASQLIDAVTGTHLWADRFDSAMEDVFELQDQLTSSVVAQLFSRVQLAEQERSFLKLTANLDAYDYYLRGTASLWGWNKEAVEKAEAHFSKAIELDQSFALAHAYLAGVFNFRKQSGWMIDFAAESDRAVRHARRAVELGREDAVALAIGGFTLAYVGEQLDFGADCIARGLSLNDNFALGWHLSGWVNIYLANHRIALEHLARAERLSPRDPIILHNRMGAALAHLLAGDFDEATRLAELITSAAPNFAPAWRVIAVGYALAGHKDRAIAAGKKLLALNPATRVSALLRLITFRRLEDRERWREGLLQAGLPE